MPSRSRFALAWCLALCWAWSSAWAADADLERMAKEPLTEEQWREVSARRGSDPAFMARAYRLGCVQRLERGELAPTPANLESVRLGLTLAQQLASKSDVAGLLLCRGRLNQGGDQSKKAEADFSLALQEAAAANESGLQALALALRGELQEAQGNLSAAQRDLLAAQRVGPPPHDYAVMALATFYNDSRIGSHADALALLQALMARLEAGPPSHRLSAARFETGLALQHLGRNPEALAALVQAQAGFEALKDAVRAARSQAHRAQVLLRLQQPVEALTLSTEALRAAALDDQVQFVAGMVRVGALRQLGKLEEAEALLGQLRQRIGSEPGPAVQAQLQEEAAELAAAAKRWELAFRARTEELEQVQALTALQKESQTQRLKLDLESARLVAESERRLAETSAALQLRRWQWALLALALASAMGLAWCALRFARQTRARQSAGSDGAQ